MAQKPLNYLMLRSNISDIVIYIYVKGISFLYYLVSVFPKYLLIRRVEGPNILELSGNLVDDQTFTNALGPKPVRDLRI